MVQTLNICHALHSLISSRSPVVDCVGCGASSKWAGRGVSLDTVAVCWVLRRTPLTGPLRSIHRQFRAGLRGRALDVPGEHSPTIAPGPCVLADALERQSVAYTTHARAGRC